MSAVTRFQKCCEEVEFLKPHVSGFAAKVLVTCWCLWEDSRCHSDERLQILREDSEIFLYKTWMGKETYWTWPRESSEDYGIAGTSWDSEITLVLASLCCTRIWKGQHSCKGMTHKCDLVFLLILSAGYQISVPPQSSGLPHILFMVFPSIF